VVATAQVHVVCTEGLSNKGNFGEPGLERDTDGETPERFGDWCIRAGVIKATTDGKNFHEQSLDPMRVIKIRDYMCNCCVQHLLFFLIFGNL
jgi:hypothetical protein